jgi:hypothetical protein
MVTLCTSKCSFGLSIPGSDGEWDELSVAAATGSFFLHYTLKKAAQASDCDSVSRKGRWLRCDVP